MWIGEIRERHIHASVWHDFTVVFLQNPLAFFAKPMYYVFSVGVAMVRASRFHHNFSKGEKP